MYKVRSTKRDDGGYDLSYGKGKKKITACTRKDPGNGDKWFVNEIGYFKKLSDLKTSWGQWASDQYNGSSKANGETAQTVHAPVPPPPPPSTRVLPPPPPPIAPRRKKGNGLIPAPPVGVAGRRAYLDDENDTRFKVEGKHTPLGMLLEIQDWHERYKDRVSEINHKLALAKIPGFNPFSLLRLMIDECIEREIPEESDNEL